MAETPVLEAVARAGVGKGAARTARREGYVPGVIYGGGTAPQTINVRFNELLKQLKAGKFLSSLLNVRIDGQDNVVICRGVQRDVVKDLPTHVDFLRLSEKSRISLHIPIEFINHEKSPGLKRGGVLNLVRHEIEFICTPDNIPQEVVVDLTGLEIGGSIHITAVDLPKGATLGVKERDFTVVTIGAPTGLKAEQEEAAAAAAAAAAAPAAGAAAPAAGGAAGGAAAPAAGGAAGAKGAAPAAGGAKAPAAGGAAKAPEKKK